MFVEYSPTQPSSDVQATGVKPGGQIRLAWTLHELTASLTVSVPFLRLELKRGSLRGTHLGRRVVVLDAEVRRYLSEASATKS